MAQSPFVVTVVTVTYNAAAAVGRTLQSALDQTQPGVQLVVIDGGSTDGTLDVVRSFGDRIHVVISEKDRGIYDAMNKGVGAASGEWVHFLNAGDTFLETDSLAKLVAAGDGADIVYGDTMLLYPDGYRRRYPAGDIRWLWARMSCQHQSMITRRSLLLEQPFDLRYRLAADHDFLMACWQRGSRFRRVDAVISLFGLDGASEGGRFVSLEEARQASLRRAPRPYTNVVYGARWCYNKFLVASDRLLPRQILRVVRTRILG